MHTAPLMRILCLSVAFIPILVSAFQRDQVIMTGEGDISSPFAQSQPTLYDRLTIEPTVSIFFSYARDTDISARFQDANTRWTLLVPTNHAVMALPQKPHQGGSTGMENGVEITEQEFEERSRQKVERWISAHIIPKSPISFSAPVYPSLLPDRYIDFRQIEAKPGSAEWSRVIIDKEIRITGMREASNGVLYIINGTITID